MMTSQVLPLLVKQAKAATQGRFTLPGVELAADAVEVEVPMAKLDGYCDACAKATKDPLLAFHTAVHLPRGAYGLLEFTSRAAPTLQAAMETFVAFSALLNEQIQQEWLAHDSGDWVLRHSVPGVPAGVGRHCNEFYLTAIVALTRQLIGARFRPERAVFAHRGPVPEAVVEFLDCPVEHGRGANLLVFGQSWLKRAPKEADPALFQVLHKVAQRSALERPARFDLSSRVRTAFDEVLAKSTGALLERVSARFRMGGRTLQRRLEAEGVRFDELLDQYRHEHAVDWVRTGKLELAEISYRLGYAQPRAFFRAFRRWTGQSPGELRQ
jgi:AraC-like DNA-binding protein